ncbi:LytR/AlgR family response regulator transcription factor [Lacihabitans soyangensis]|jgi:DNA-binding LytR/AlgR family response regulator|uniref:LytTR family transcriptional regulator n=1 Tax=Lacihabitans soyangensis TaxID=869394 RepID=A0AAE3H0H2_9BACT|nr:LytTR family DNA-binding domain-containing protein [Lacihabitans soyangensis]MCP9761791.1 LytTR family transcriptional regulator [Lacihabitans soyangensis]
MKLLYSKPMMMSTPMRLPSVGVLSTETDMQMRVAGKKNLIDLNDIVYLKSAKNYTIFKLRSGKDVISSKTLGIFEEELKGVSNFVRPHRSYIVNFDFVKDLLFNCRGGELFMDKEVINISRRKAADFRRHYRRFLTASGKNVSTTIRMKTKLRVS